jgi:hypothetical protein
MGGDCSLLPQRADIEEAGIGHDRAQETGKPQQNEQT